MLHILLLILKIIGIVLAVILGIIVLLVCVVLFVPVRYEARGGCAGDASTLKGKVRVTWLLRLVQADLSFREKKLKWRFRIAWKKILGGRSFGGASGGEEPEAAAEIDVDVAQSGDETVAGGAQRQNKSGPTAAGTQSRNKSGADSGEMQNRKTQKDGKDPHPADGKTEPERKDLNLTDEKNESAEEDPHLTDGKTVSEEDPHLTDKKPESGENESNAGTDRPGSENRPEKAAGKEGEHESKETDRSGKETEEGQNGRAEPADVEKRRAEGQQVLEGAEPADKGNDRPRGKDVKEDRGKGSKKAAGSGKNATEDRSERDEEAPGPGERIGRKIEKIKCTIQEFCDKIKTLSVKKDKVVEFLQDETHVQAFLKVKKEALRFLGTLKPRLFCGNACFGLGDPGQTGMVLGACSAVLLPLGMDIDLEPDFENRTLKGDLHLQGKIRICHAAAMALRLLLTKNVRRTYKDIRNFKL